MFILMYSRLDLVFYKCTRPLYLIHSRSFLMSFRHHDVKTTNKYTLLFLRTSFIILNCFSLINASSNNEVNYSLIMFARVPLISLLNAHIYFCFIIVILKQICSWVCFRTAWPKFNVCQICWFFFIN